MRISFHVVTNLLPFTMSFGQVLLGNHHGSDRAAS